MVKKLKTLSASKEHILARQYMLAAALKAIVQTAFGSYFKSDKQIMEFEVAYDVVSFSCSIVVNGVHVEFMTFEFKRMRRED